MKSSIFNICKQTEDDISKLDLNTDIFKWFDPLLWIESNEKLFFMSIMDFSENNSTELYLILLKELLDRFTKISNANIQISCSKLQTPAIMTLILWEIIKHIQIKPTENSGLNEEISDLLTNVVVYDYSQIRYSDEYINLFKNLYKSVIKSTGFLGTSLIKKVFIKIDEMKTDLHKALNQLSITICSIDTFKYFLANSEKLFLSVNKQDKPAFYESYYEIISNFYINYPQIHQTFVVSGLDEASTLFISLAKQKIIEPQILPVLSSLLPLTYSNNKLSNDKTKKTIQPIFKSIQGFGSKKDPTIQRHYIEAFLELIEGSFYSNNSEDEPFISINKFIEKNIKEFENILLTNLSDSHPDKKLLSLVTRYASYDFIFNANAKNADRPRPIDSIIEKAVICQSWSYWERAIEFFIYIFNRWSQHPRYKKIIESFVSKSEKIFRITLDKTFQICKSCNGIINRVLDDDSCADFVQSLTQLFEYSTINFSVYSSFKLQYSEYSSTSMKIYFPYQTTVLYEDGIDLETFIKFLLGLIPMAFRVSSRTLMSTASCLRNIWTFNEKSVEGKDNKTILNHVYEIVKVFYEAIKSSMEHFFNGMTYYQIYPYLFYRFLHWSYSALKATLEKEDQNQNKSILMTVNYIQNFLNASLIIHAISSDQVTIQLANNCDRLIKEIIQLYNVDLFESGFISYTTRHEKIEGNVSLLTNITGEIFDLWLKFVKKQIDDVERALFTEKGSVKEAVISRAFLASSLQLTATSSSPSLAQNLSASNSNLSGNMTLSNSSMVISSNANSSTTLLSPKEVQIRKLISNQHLISSVTSFLCRFIEILKNDVFNKLINKINFSSQIGENDNSSENEDVLREFFSMCYSYINSLPSVDISFTTSFKTLNDDSIRIFIDLAKSRLLKKVQNFQYGRPYFWLNFIQICITLSSREKLTTNIIHFIIDDVIPIFFSIIEFNVFSNSFLAPLMNSMCDLISVFYKYIYNCKDCFDLTILYPKQRLTIYSILEICINFANSDQITFFEILQTALRTLSSLFENLDLNITSSNHHVDDISSEQRFYKDVIFFLSFFNICIQQTQNVDVITWVLKCMNYIIKNNPSSWPVYAYFADTSNQLFKALLIESLTITCGSIYHSQIDYESMMAPQKDKTILKSQREKMEVNYLLYSVKSKLEDSSYDNFELIKSFPYKELTKPFDILTRDNFSFFKTNQTNNLRFLESCISCVVFYNMHDNLFEEMTKQVKSHSFDSQNPVSLFFTCWILYSVRKWQLTPLINSVSLNEPNNFIDQFDPPPFFAYYIAKFAKLTSNSACKDMFLKCFLEPLIYCPLTYDVKKFISKSLAEKFISKLIELPEFDKLLSSLIEAQLIYPVIDNEHFPIDRSLVLSFISERPKAIDKLYGMIDQKSYDQIEEIKEDSAKCTAIQYINFLSVSDWIKDAGIINNCRVIYVLISNISVVAPNSIAADFFNHFSSSSDDKKLIFMVDLSFIPDKDSIFEAFLKISEQASDDFTSRIEKVYLVNPSMDTTQLLNEKLGNKIQLSWVNKYEIVSDITTVIPKDSKVYLPISLFSTIKEQKYSFNVKYQQEMALFSICDDSFVLSTHRSLFINNNILNRISFPISSIDSLKELNDNKGRFVTIQAHFASNGPKEYRIETDNSNSILFVYNLLRQRYNFGSSTRLVSHNATTTTTATASSFRVSNLASTASSSNLVTSNNNNRNSANNIEINFIKNSDSDKKLRDILLSISPSLQTQMLSYSIYQMSSPESIKALGFQMFQLFESAFNFDDEPSFHMTKSMPFDNENMINLSILFNMIEKKSVKLLENVAICVSFYLNSKTSSQSLQNLLPLFVRFINITNNKSSMCRVLTNILKTSRKQPNISILERFFFSKFTNDLAFDVTIPILIRASKGIKGREASRTEEFIDNVYIEIYLQSLMNVNPKIVCEIIEKNLSGSVSKRSFGNLFPTDKVLATIISLPFHSKEFLSNNLGLFFFCSLLEGIYDPPGVVTYTKKCYNMIFSLLVYIKGEGVPQMLSYMQNIMKMIENPRILKLSDLINSIDELLLLLDQNQHDTFRQLLTASTKEYNIRNWYIKGFAEAFFNKGSLESAVRFIKLMPDLYISPLYGFQKLAICYDTFEILIRNDKISQDKQIPLQLLWASLISSTHPNTRLRESSLQLLKTIMTYLYSKSDTKIVSEFIKEVISSRNDSEIFNSIVTEFEKLMDIDFNSSYSVSIISILVKGTCGMDMESRKNPNDFFKWCFKSFKSDMRTAVMFLLPLLIFQNSFYYTSTVYSVSTSAEISSFLSNSSISSSKILEWANASLESEQFKSIQEIIFYDFEQRSEDEKNWILCFLDRFFGESSCPYCVGVIADTLLYGVDHFGSILCRINRSIIEKCQSMIDILKSVDGVEKLSTIIAAFVDASNKSSVTQTEIAKDIYKRADKEKISELIVKTINEITRLAKKR
ncbi:hypothetical protein M9Y10_018988 [Tritrichomonas musculus]|uniref:HECT domain-containing protein n=1 Tax=Tritrichomonas musculus TaxID=1915356 RepID=A0ABR2HI89_9EUKA